MSADARIVRAVDGAYTAAPGTGRPRAAHFGAYLRAPAGIRHGTGLYVLTLTSDRICA